MSTVLVRYGLVAVLLAAIGVGLWRVGRLQEGAASTQRRLLTLEFDVPADEYDALTRAARIVRPLPGLSAVGEDLRAQQATASYWRGSYGDLQLATSVTGEITESNPALLLLAANAAYRSEAIDESSPAAVQRMEALIARYADILRRPTWQPDAAYNYEFVARRRDALIRSRGRAAARRTDEEAQRVESTLHGQPGAVPPGTDMQEFKVVVPQRSDERREQPEAGKGGPKARKG